MLHITDTRTGTHAELAPGRLTRIDAHPTGADTPTAVRVLLVADVLARALELAGAPVRTGLVAPDLPAEVRAHATALGIRPPDAQGDPARLARELGGGPGIRVCPAGGGTEDDGGVRVEVADAGWPQGADGSGPDPSVLRLALLTHPCGTPLHLTAERLAAAGEALARRRKAVARWADAPSRPVPDAVRHELRDAWEDDLDVPAVLGVLERLERDDDLPPGALFETFVYADRLLGLELARDIGRTP